MLALKRVVTAIAICLPLVFLIYIMCLLLGGAIVGASAGVQNPDNPHAAGEAAGQKFGEIYGGVLFLASLIISLIISVILSFTRILPWCRPKGGTFE